MQLPGGLLVTPWHPVRIEGIWKFPSDLAEGVQAEVPCDKVYTFVLEAGHVLRINGVECVGLGHDFTEDTVRHEYFGSPRVVQDLVRCTGWKEGCVTFADGCFLRDPVSRLVCGLDANKFLPDPTPACANTGDDSCVTMPLMPAEPHYCALHEAGAVSICDALTTARSA